MFGACYGLHYCLGDCDAGLGCLSGVGEFCGMPLRHVVPPGVHVDGICRRCGHWHMVHPQPPPSLCRTGKEDTGKQKVA